MQAEEEEKRKAEALAKNESTAGQQPAAGNAESLLGAISAGINSLGEMASKLADEVEVEINGNITQEQPVQNPPAEPLRVEKDNETQTATKPVAPGSAGEDVNVQMTSGVVAAEAGRSLTEGPRVAKHGEFETAFRHWQRLAEQGDPKAQHNLGVIHYFGEGVPPDIQEAIRRFRQAAEEGYASAQLSLGLIYERGDGLPRDTSIGAKWYRQAAEQGLTEAQYYLGLHYEEADKKKQSIKWYHQAAKRGHKEAMSSLTLLCVHARGEAAQDCKRTSDSLRGFYQEREAKQKQDQAKAEKEKAERETPAAREAAITQCLAEPDVGFPGFRANVQGGEPPDMGKLARQKGPARKCMNCDLNGADLAGWDLQGSNLNGAKLRGANLAEANLSGAYLHKADLSEANLTGVTLDGATISGAIFTNAVLDDQAVTSLKSAYDESYDIKRTREDYQEAYLSVPEQFHDVIGIQRESSLLSSSPDPNAKTMVPASIDKAALGIKDQKKDINQFSKVRLKGLLGRGQCLKCDLRNFDLSGLVLSGLKRSDLSGAVLKGILPRSEYRGIDFQGTRLVLADLSGADLSNSNFQDADLRGANFHDAKLTGAKFQNALFDDAAFATLPEDIKPLARIVMRYPETETNLAVGTSAFGDGVSEAGSKVTVDNASWLTPKQKKDLAEDGSCYECDLRNVDLTGVRLNILEGADLSGVDLSKLEVWDAVDFSDANLSGANLSGLDLSGRSRLSSANLSNANLTGTNLSRANMIMTDLTGANLRGADLTRADLSYSKLINVDLTDAKLDAAKFSEAVLDERNFNLLSVQARASAKSVKVAALPTKNQPQNLQTPEKATRAKVNLTDATLPTATGTAKATTEVAAKDGQQPVTAKEVVTGAKLSGRNLAGLKLKGANLTSIDLSNADLTNADLRGASLWHANLSGANLTGAKLMNANLDRADLRYANLTNANLSQANMAGVMLQGANFTGAKLIFTRMGIAQASPTGGDFATNFVDVNFTNANLKFANWRGVGIIDRVDFSGANLSNAETPGSGGHKTFPGIALGVTLKNANLSGVVLGSGGARCSGLGNSCLIETSLTEWFKSGVEFNPTAGTKIFVFKGGLLALILKRSQLSQFGDNWNNVSKNYPDRLLEAIYFPAGYDDSADDPILALNLRGAMALAEEGILKISHPYHLKTTLDFFNRSFPKQITATRKRRKEQEQVTKKECKGCDYKNQDLRDKNFAEGNLEGSDFSGANLAGVDLWGAKLKGATLIGADLSGADLRGAELDGANLEGANLKCANLSQANLSEAVLSGANLQGTILYRTTLTRTVANNASFVNAFIYEGNLNNGEYRGAWFSGSILPAYLFGSDFSGASFKGAHFHLTAEAVQERIGSRRITVPRYNSEGDLRDSPTTLDSVTGWRNPRANYGPELENLNLRGAELTGLDLRGGSLAGSNLDGAIMVGADLGTWDRSLYSWESKVTRNAYFRWPEGGLRKTRQTDLSGSSVRGADLTAARLQGAKLDNADFSDALLWRTDLDLAEIEVTDFHGAIIDVWGLKPLEDYIDMGLFESMDCSAEDVRAVQQRIPDLQPEFCRKIAQE